MLLPRGLRAEQGREATLDLEAVSAQSGTTDSIVVSTAALSGTPAVSEAYTLGPVMLNGTQLSGVQGVSIDTGLQEIVLFADGKTQPQHAGIIRRQPSITISLTDAGVFDDLDIGGVSISANVVVYLRKLVDGGTVVADDASTNISIAVAAGMAHMEPFGVSQGGHATPTIRITPTKGVAAIYVIDTTADIVTGS